MIRVVSDTGVAVLSRWTLATGPSLATALDGDDTTADIADIMADPTRPLLMSIAVPTGLVLAGGVLVHRVAPWTDILPCVTVDAGATLYSVTGGENPAIRTPADITQISPLTGTASGLMSPGSAAITFTPGDRAPNGTTDDAWLHIVLFWMAPLPGVVSILQPS